ncbi:MAG: LysR family transcriptional regulator, partial [Alphaproteobacteria bacterium]|nr:LysR family transcriptional regulator [Alphaproteobacteria bacterium]
MALLENIRVFVRVVELGSFSAAARNLRLSPAVVSHRIQQLEGHVGVRLLNRTTRQVQPTEQGMLYYEACLEVMRAVEQAETSVAGAGAEPQGTLKVTAPLVFGRRILAP